MFGWILDDYGYSDSCWIFMFFRFGQECLKLFFYFMLVVLEGRKFDFQFISFCVLEVVFEKICFVCFQI